MSSTEFKHYQHAHCESGVTANLLRHEGIDISEPLAFGIGAGIFFAHVPFVKISGTPGTTFRIWPGAIFKRTVKRLGIGMHTERFSSADKAMDKLNEVLDSGRPVGMQSSVYYLPYLPEAFRFHFNAHNLVAYGRENGNYLISDPVMEHVATISREDLAKARFAKGAPEPRGFMYYVNKVPAKINFDEAIKAGIRQAGNMMMMPRMPWFGNRGIFTLAKQVRQYPRKLEPRKAALYLGNIIRMQEEIGTGGAGFRFLQAAFLQEAAQLMKRDDLARFSEELTAIGDDWRSFAYHAARLMKDRKSDIISYDDLADMLQQVGEKEKDFFNRMRKIKW